MGLSPEFSFIFLLSCLPVGKLHTPMILPIKKRHQFPLKPRLPPPYFVLYIPCFSHRFPHHFPQPSDPSFQFFSPDTRCVSKMQCGDPSTGTLRNASIPDESLNCVCDFIAVWGDGGFHGGTPIAGWWFGTWILFSQKYWESHHPNWRSYFSDGWPNHQPVVG